MSCKLAVSILSFSDPVVDLCLAHALHYRYVYLVVYVQEVHTFDKQKQDDRKHFFLEFDMVTILTCAILSLLLSDSDTICLLTSLALVLTDGITRGYVPVL